MLKAIVFDFDGVIVDSEPLHYRAFLRIAEQFGVTFDYQQYMRDYVGFDDRDGLRAILAGSPHAALTRDPKTLADLCEQKADAFEACVNEHVDAIPGAVELIREAAASMPIAIASGATQRDIDLVLRKLGLTDAFRVIISADDVPRSKPDPQTYRIAVRRLAENGNQALLPDECLAIEDTGAGIESARGAGLLTLGLNSLGNPAQLRRAHRVVDSLAGVTVAQLRQWFD